MKCRHCDGDCYKRGFQTNGTQRIQCKKCKKYQQRSYQYKAYTRGINKLIINCIRDGVSIRGIGRIVEISINTAVERIKAIAKSTRPPRSLTPQRSYEVDEMWTFIGTKSQPCWIMYAIDRATREPVALRIGNRTKQNIEHIIAKLLRSYPKKIYTDRLNIYSKLIPKPIHSRTQYCTNHIERNNLTLRTNLKRLQRRTICFSRSFEMLAACLSIFFWA